MRRVLALIFGIIVFLSSCTSHNLTLLDSKRTRSANKQINEQLSRTSPNDSILYDIPDYIGNAYIELNNNIPQFSYSDLTTKAFEKYSELDSLGRCGVAYANIGKEIMPTEKRNKIGQIKPSGWKTVRYDFINGKYLYNRCHLIAYQLAGENSNERNLITGTRYMNTDGMTLFENKVSKYIKETGNHVLYRVTPLFNANNLLASGVQIEALSVEDIGASICFNVFCYNVQPGVRINYATGDSEPE